MTTFRPQKEMAATPTESVYVNSGVVHSLLSGEVCFLTAHVRLATPMTFDDKRNFRDWNDRVAEVAILASDHDEQRVAMALSLSTLLNVTLSYNLGDGRDKQKCFENNKGSGHRLSAKVQSVQKNSTRNKFIRLRSCIDEMSHFLDSRRISVEVGVAVIPPSAESNQGFNACSDASWQDIVSIRLHPLQLIKCFITSTLDPVSSSLDHGLWGELSSILATCKTFCGSPSISKLFIFSYLREKSFLMPFISSFSPQNMISEMNIPVMENFGESVSDSNVDNDSQHSFRVLRNIFLELALHSNQPVRSTALTRIQNCSTRDSEDEGNVMGVSDENTRINVMHGALYGRHYDDIRAAMRGIQYRVALNSYRLRLPLTAMIRFRGSFCMKHSARTCTRLAYILSTLMYDELECIAFAWRSMNVCHLEKAVSRNDGSNHGIDRSVIYLGPFVYLDLRDIANFKDSVVYQILNCKRRTDLAVAMLLLAQYSLL